MAFIRILLSCLDQSNSGSTNRYKNVTACLNRPKRNKQTLRYIYAIASAHSDSVASLPAKQNTWTSVRDKITPSTALQCHNATVLYCARCPACSTKSCPHAQELSVGLCRTRRKVMSNTCSVSLISCLLACLLAAAETVYRWPSGVVWSYTRI